MPFESKTHLFRRHHWVRRGCRRSGRRRSGRGVGWRTLTWLDAGTEPKRDVHLFEKYFVYLSLFSATTRLLVSFPPNVKSAFIVLVSLSYNMGSQI